jgi:hypothetical protein
MKKLADLYLNYDVKSSEYKVSSYDNMNEKDQLLVEDLMIDARVKLQINNACKNINRIERGDKNIEVAKVDVNLNSTISSNANVRVVISLLKLDDESDMLISLYSLVEAPSM